MIASLLLAATLGLQHDVAPTAELTIDRTSVATGKPIRATVSVTFAEGYHAYQNPPSDKYQIPLSVALKSAGKLVKVKYPKGVDMNVAGDTKPSKVYAGTIKIPVEVRPSSAGPIIINVNYQQCTDQNCWPPKTVTATAPIAQGKKG